MSVEINICPKCGGRQLRSGFHPGRVPDTWSGYVLCGDCGFSIDGPTVRPRSLAVSEAVKIWNNIDRSRMNTEDLPSHSEGKNPQQAEVKMNGEIQVFSFEGC